MASKLCLLGLATAVACSYDATELVKPASGGRDASVTGTADAASGGNAGTGDGGTTTGTGGMAGGPGSGGMVSSDAPIVGGSGGMGGGSGGLSVGSGGVSGGSGGLATAGSGGSGGTAVGSGGTADGSGGVPASGGTGGLIATGGIVGAGGTVASGGVVGSGGVAASGGITGSGGAAGLDGGVDAAVSTNCTLFFGSPPSGLPGHPPIIGTAAACVATCDAIAGWGCTNGDSRTITVNGSPVHCGDSIAASNGYFRFEFGAGTNPNFGIFWWGTWATTCGASGTGGTFGTDTGENLGSGGASGAGGGGVTGSGGSTAVAMTYNCASPIVPENGVVTDPTDWDATTSGWGSGGTLIGSIFQFSGGGASMTGKVGGSPVGLNLTGSVPANGFAGGGLTFFSCVTAASFTKIFFDVYGSANNCDIELQLQTYDQRPIDFSSLPGGCKSDASSSSCYNYPHKSRVVTPPATNVSVSLPDLSNWSSAEAAQIVGVQWLFLSSNSDTCSPDVTFTNIRFE